jgi:energy-coupling factor transport system substrate-specific component
MSWEAWSFVVLGAVLLGGFAWYERSRPPSQVVALVAALAALAVAGRLAFAAIPNVVATTDIVIFSGYAIGPAPGFAVGALAGLVSNFWLGQGPWTPWQMAAWGLCGVFGAILAWRGRRMGRAGLAIACGLAGVAYGALLNFSLMASYGGELSLNRFLTLEVRAIPFDAAHSIGNVTLALIAGPAMVRMLVRFRERFEWREGGSQKSEVRVPGVKAGGVAALLIAGLAVGTWGAPAARASGRAEAVSWLVGSQNPDGGFSSSRGDRSSVAITGWAMLGLEASGRNPLDVIRGGRSPVEFLRRKSSSISSTGDLARTILALEGAGVSSRHFARRNLVRELRRRRRTNGSFEGWPNATAFGVLALRAAGARAGSAHSLHWLRRMQNDDGGWGVVPRSSSDADSTGAVLQAVGGRRTVGRAIRYLRRTQVRGGGFRLGGSGVVNAQSTAWAAQGMLAADVRPRRIHEAGRDAFDYLSARQAADGHLRYSKRSDQTPVWVTAQALVPLYGKSYPLAPVPRARRSQAAANSNETTAPSTSSSAGSPTPIPPTVPPSTPAGDGAGAPPNRTQHERAGSAGGDRKQSSRGVRGGEGSGTGPEVRPSSGTVGGTPASAETTDDGSASPAVPIAIGLGVAALVATGLWWIGRRRAW